MLIDTITLNNFRQYKGTNNIQFSTNPEKNVTIITGENTCGKTTLVQSFIWCLYGKIDFKDKEILNAEVRNELMNGTIGSKKSASVNVRLSHNGTDYLITRKEEYELNNLMKLTTEKKFSIYEIDQSKNTIPLNKDDFHKVIENILPENLSDYFFFWGERIEKLSEQKELQEAVKQFLGLDTIDAAIKHLTKAQNKLIRDLGKNTNDADISNVTERIKKLEQKSYEIEEKINGCNNNISYYKDKSNKLYSELTTSENKQLQAKQNEFKQNSTWLEEKRRSLESKKNEFNATFNDVSNYVYLFASKKEKQAVELLKKNPEPVIGWNSIDVNVINEILKKGKCICGSEFCEGDHIYKTLLEQKKIVAPNQIGGVINTFVEQSERRQNFNITGKSDMKEKHKRYEECNNKISCSERELGRLESDKEKNQREIENCKKQIENLISKNKKYSKQKQTIGLVELVLKAFVSNYRNNEEKLKSRLEFYVNKNFSEVYSGTRKIEIDNKYNAVALNKVGDNWIKSETSPGLETVKNFAFIAGLIQCAKEKIVGGDGAETEANPNHYPLVLDAPFSQADENHIPAISKLLASNAEQIILVVMKKDWNYAKDILNDKVGKSYLLTKESETHTNIIEEDL